MKSRALMLLFMASGISPMSAAAQGIDYYTATGAVVPEFDPPTSTKTGGTDAMAVRNVRSAPYNGKGDGVTNDTNAIQAAINDAEGLGGTVYLPAGTWMFSALRV